MPMVSDSPIFLITFQSCWACLRSYSRQINPNIVEHLLQGLQLIFSLIIPKHKNMNVKSLNTFEKIYTLHFFSNHLEISTTKLFPILNCLVFHTFYVILRTQDSCSPKVTTTHPIKLPTTNIKSHWSNIQFTICNWLISKMTHFSD